MQNPFDANGINLGGSHGVPEWRLAQVRSQWDNGNTSTHHDHIWDDMADPIYGPPHTDREGSVIQWWRCAICDATRFRRRDVV